MLLAEVPISYDKRRRAVSLKEEQLAGPRIVGYRLLATAYDKITSSSVAAQQHKAVTNNQQTLRCPARVPLEEDDSS